MTLRALEEKLAAAGVPDPKTDARLLITHFCGISPAMLYADRDRDHSTPELYAAVARRCTREPLQHILGETYFYGERYLVSSDCLAPRADTEVLVEEAARVLPKGARFADLCTGSGCIALALLAVRQDLTAVAVDVSEKALAIARENASLLGVSDRVEFVSLDLLRDEPLFPMPDEILSNPPYIATDVIPTLAPELHFEPRLALDGGGDGLTFYRTFLEKFTPRRFFFEIGYDQNTAVTALGEAHSYTARTLRDANGCDRVVILEK